MAGTNESSQFQADVEAYIADETLPLARRQLVAYQFGDPLTLPKGHGTSYIGTRYNRIPLPFAPLSEGVPPIGETMTIQQVVATAQQWGDKVTLTDVAEITIKHPLFQKATELTGLQIAETLERNTFNALLGGTQINYVNSRGSRGALVAGDVLDTQTVIRRKTWRSIFMSIIAIARDHCPWPPSPTLPSSPPVRSARSPRSPLPHLVRSPRALPPRPDWRRDRRHRCRGHPFAFGIGCPARLHQRIRPHVLDAVKASCLLVIFAQRVTDPIVG